MISLKLFMLKCRVNLRGILNIQKQNFYKHVSSFRSYYFYDTVVYHFLVGVQNIMRQNVSLKHSESLIAVLRLLLQFKYKTS